MTDIEILFASGVAAHHRGELAMAAAIYRQVIALQPKHTYAASALAASLGDTAAAERLLERATIAVPGQGLPFSRLTALRLRRRFGAPPPPRALSPGPGVTAHTLGANGRFGNQLLQYGVLRALADRQGVGFACGDWIGRDLFALDDPYCGSGEDIVTDQDPRLVDALAGRARLTDIDLVGFFQFSTAHWRFFRDRFHALCRLAPAPAAAVRQLLAPLAGRTVIAVHVRRGDFVTGDGWIAPLAPYRDWAAQAIAASERPLLYVASDDAAAAAAFADLAPVTAADLGTVAPGVAFLTDFAVMTIADRLAIANSTFSFTAAMLNGRGARFVRPEPDRAGLFPFDPWDARPLL